MDVRQASLYAVVVERQPLVVDAQQVQDSGVEVVGRHRVDDRVIADGVGGPVGEALLQPRAGEDIGEALRVVVTSSASSPVNVMSAWPFQRLDRIIRARSGSVAGIERDRLILEGLVPS